MKKLLFFGVVLLLFSCTDKIRVTGHRTEELREITGYDKIDVSDGIRTNIHDTEQEGIVVKTFSSIQEYVKTHVRNGTLYVEIETDKRFSEDPNVVVTISARGIKAMILSGGVEAKSEGASFVSKEAVELHLSGGSSFRGEVLTHQLNMELGGGSSVVLTGGCTGMTLVSSGGANSNCSAFQTDLFSVDLSGGSKCEITVNDRIEKASLSGGSSLYYRGTRIVNNVNVARGSELISRN